MELRRREEIVMKYLRLLVLITTVCFVNVDGYAQLKKTGNVEKVRSFTNGTVVLNKVIIDSIELYSVTLPTGSKYYDDIVFWLGTREELLKNLSDLSLALKDGKKGDFYEFSVCGQDYHLSYHKVLGQVCFKVREPYSTGDDYANFYKDTIEDILEYMQNYNN